MMKKNLFLVFLTFFLIGIIGCGKSNDIVLEEEIIEDDSLEETSNVLSKVVLEANGEGKTYELINSVFADPNYNVVEVPDCSHESFGRHIDQLFDNDLNKNVFRFHIHTTPDNDRCIKFDRQRNEIKTYDKSSNELKGIQNEKVEYSWKFKLPSDLKSSKNFTHIHQLKAVGGEEDAMPLITLTTRKGSPDKLELRYAETNNQITLKKVDLLPFKGVWIEAVETVIYGEKGVGNYKIELKDIKTDKLLFSYLNNDIRMWKTNAAFIRPKWGIYRSLNDATNLQDEIVLFADFSVSELKR